MRVDPRGGFTEGGGGGRGRGSAGLVAGRAGFRRAKERSGRKSETADALARRRIVWSSLSLGGGNLPAAVGLVERELEMRGRAEV
jgi:hypothetical protein